MVPSTKKHLKRINILSIKVVFPIAALIVIVAWIGICLLSRQPGELALVQFLSLAMMMLLATIIVLWTCNKDQIDLPFWWVIFTAVALRLISVGGEPLFEDDYYRYLWDGYQTVTTNDPYTHAPAVFFDLDVPAGFEPILSLINYPEIATVYGPVAQWFFAIAYLIAPGEVWPLQLMSGLADLLIICLLRQLGAGNALLLYAWSPLILKEFSLTAHPDVISIAFMFASIVAAYQQRVLLAGFALGLALGAKVFAILILPFLLSCRWSWAYWLWFCSSMAACLGMITLYFGSLTIWVPEGLLAMAESWLFNSPIYYLLLPITSFQSLKVMLLSGFVLYAMAAFCRRMHRLWIARKSQLDHQPLWSLSTSAFRGDYLFALFLLSLPVINPWYLAWLLPFATLHPRWWSWTASYAVLLSYWYGSNVGAIGADSQQLPISVLSTEYLLIILVPAAAWAVRRHRSRI